MKTVALFGAGGGLGSQLRPLLKQKYDVFALRSTDVDITDLNQVNQFFHLYHPDIVVNLSGYNYDSFLHKYSQDNYDEVNKQIDVNIKGNINILSSFFI